MVTVIVSSMGMPRSRRSSSVSSGVSSNVGMRKDKVMNIVRRNTGERFMRAYPAAQIRRYLQLLLEVESRQPASGLLGGHGLGNLHSHLAKSAPAVEAVRRSLNLGGAYEHLTKAERACHFFRAFEHAFGNTCAAELAVQIHPA